VTNRHNRRSARVLRAVGCIVLFVFIIGLLVIFGVLDMIF
jgi:hypothetical protein